jgi:hypothetical protein
MCRKDSETARPSDEKDLTIAVFQTAISNLFIPRALPWVSMIRIWQSERLQLHRITFFAYNNGIADKKRE